MPPRWGWSSGACRLGAERRVRHRQSLVTAPQAGCEAERRRRMSDMDLCGVYTSTRDRYALRGGKRRGHGTSGSWRACLTRNSRTEADSARRIRGGCGRKASVVRGKWMRLKRQTRRQRAVRGISTRSWAIVVVYLGHSLEPDVVSACGVRALAKKICVRRSCVGVHGWLYLGGCARDETVVHATLIARDSEFRSENCSLGVRPWTEVGTLFGTLMSDILSGGLAFSYFATQSQGHELTRPPSRPTTPASPPLGTFTTSPRSTPAE
ncbi:hypothetical protein K438DRAFT_1991252 [Mycena galopus ATCC 62051]|nr:hypothetical protein K438DRAFT_1991252 [Mycena galopus ATCC 62051]